MKRIILGSLVSLALVGCGPQAAAPQCTADSYPDEGYSTNAATELALRERFEALATKMDETATPGTRVTAAELTTLFADGTPSVKSISTDAAQAAIAEVFPKLEAASGNTWTPVDPPAGTGGVWVKYVFSNRGVDLGETVEKLVFAGAHYNAAAKLMTDSATVADVDRMVALFGASPAFPMDDKAAMNPDVLSAKYAKRRTNPAAATPGPYLAIKQAFMNARASVKAGSACAAQRTEAFTTIRDQWERTLLGTAIFYLNTAATTLEKPTPTETEKAGALHQVGEAVGFLRGLKTLPAQYRVMTDAQLDQVLGTLGGATVDGSEAYKLITDTASTTGRLTTAVSQIQTARQFTSEEIALYKTTF